MRTRTVAVGIVTALCAAWLSGGSPAAAATPTCGTTGVPAVSAVTDTALLINSAAGLDAGYLGYKITPTSQVNNLWVGTGTISGGKAVFVPGQPTYQPAGGTVTAGSSGYVFFLMQGTGATTTASKFTMTVYNGNPYLTGATALCTFAAQVDRVVTASATGGGTITDVSMSSVDGSGSTGEQVVVTVQGTTGTIGTGPTWDAKALSWTPNASSTFPVGAWRLTSTSITTAAGTYTNLLRKTNATADQGAYTARYTFTAVDPYYSPGVRYISPPTVTPGTYNASGSTMAIPVSYPASLPALSISVGNNLLVSSSTDRATLPATGGTVTHSVTVSNPGAVDARVDDVEVVFPAGATLVPSSTVVAGVAAADPQKQGSTYVFPGPFTVPAGGVLTVSYQASYPSGTKSYTMQSSARVVNIVLDTTLETLDSVPATSTVQVLPAGPTVNDASMTTTGVTPVSVTPTTTGTVDSSATCIITATRPFTTCSAGPWSPPLVNPPGTWQVNTSTRAITFTPNVGFSGSTSVTYRVSDSYGQTASSTVSVTVNKPAAPVVTVKPASVSGPAPLSLAPTVTGTGIVPEQAALRDPADSALKQTVTVPSEGTYSVDGGTGDVVFTAAVGFSGSATPVTYQATDAYGQTGTASISVAVAKPAPPAVAASSSASTSGVDPVTLTPSISSDTYVVPALTRIQAGDATWRSGADVPGEGSWSVNAGTGAVTFTPVAGFTGTTTAVTYRVTDAYGQSSSGSVSAAVSAPVAPTVSTTPRSTAHNTPITFTPSTTVTGTPTFALYNTLNSTTSTSQTIAGKGTWSVNVSTGAVTFSPLAGFVGTSDEVKYQVNDPYGRSVRETVSVTVATPPAPTVSTEGTTTAFNTPVTVIPLVVGDTDPATARLLDPADDQWKTSVTISGQGTWAINEETGRPRFTPVYGFTGSARQISYRIADTYGQDATADLNVIVETPAAPSVSDAEGSTPFRTTGSVRPAISGTDIRHSLARLRDPADNAWKTTVTVPDEGTWAVDTSTGEVTFEPAYRFTGTTTAVRYRASDAYTQTSTATLTFQVSKPAAPTVLTQPGAAAYDMPLRFTPSVSGTDVDASLARLRDPADNTWKTTVTVPDEGTWTVDSDTGEVTFDPLPSFVGTPTSITYRAADGYAQTGAADLAGQISLPGAPHVAAATADTSFATGTAVNPDVNGTLVQPGLARLQDPSDGLWKTSVTVDGQGAWAVDEATGQPSFTPVRGFHGAATGVLYRVSDLFGQTGAGLLGVTVAPPAPPAMTDASTAVGYLQRASATPATVAGDGSITGFCLVRPDTSCDATLSAANGAWSIDPTSGEVTFQPTRAFAGTTSVVARTVDDLGLSAEAIVTITVTAPAAPTISGPSGSAPYATPVSVYPEVSGPGAAAATLRVKDPTTEEWDTLTALPAGVWAVDTATGAITFTPAAGWAGTSSITARVTDDLGRQATSTLVATVAPPAGPVVEDLRASAGYGTAPVLAPKVTSPATYPMSGFSLSTPSDPTPRSVLTVAGEGTWQVYSNGKAQFYPAKTFSGTTSAVTYRATDRWGQSGTATITVTVSPPAVPVVTDTSVTWAYGTTGMIVTPTVSGTQLVPSSARLLDPSDGVWKTRVTVANEATWTVYTSGKVEVVPLKTVAGPLTPVRYQMGDVFAQTGAGTITVTITAPAAPAVAPTSGTWAYGTAAPFLAPVVTGTQLRPATSCVIDPADSACKTSVTIAGEGTWTVYTSSGKALFTPLRTFAGRATTVLYRQADVFGQTGTGSITVTVTPPAAPAVTVATYTATDYGTQVAVSPVVVGTLVQPAAACLIDPADGLCKGSITITGQGTWKVNAVSGKVLFTPASRFAGPTDAVTYRASDVFGQTGEGTFQVLVGLKSFLYFASGSSLLSSTSLATVKTTTSQATTSPVTVAVTVNGYLPPDATEADAALANARAAAVAAEIRKSGVLVTVLDPVQAATLTDSRTVRVILRYSPA